MYACVSLAWAVLFLTDTIQVWHACLLLVIHGMAGVLGGREALSIQLLIRRHMDRLEPEDRRSVRRFMSKCEGH